MKSKKTIALIAALMLSVTMLASCSDDDDKLSSATTTTTTTTEAQTEEDTTEEEATEVETTEEETTEEEVEANASSGDIDAVDGASSTAENPIALGEWCNVALYSPVDKAYHNVQIRINKVTTTTEDPDYIQDCIDTNNKYASEYYQFTVDDLELPSDCELCVFEYEMNIPSDFPTADYGLTLPTVTLSIENIDGGGIPNAEGTATYIGLSTTYSLETGEEIEYEVGNTYQFKKYFAMVQGYEDYVFETYNYPDGTTDTSDAEFIYAYFASR
ncbi:MAG: hypothetical protein LUC25_08230 [Ruminococcus sp.]|nr:hypothetical protein [Ruminococcus sp.]